MERNIQTSQVNENVQTELNREKKENTEVNNQPFIANSRTTPRWVWLFDGKQSQECRMKQFEKFKNRYDFFCYKNHITHKYQQDNLPEIYLRRFAGIKPLISNAPIKLKHNSHVTRRLLQQKYEEFINKMKMTESGTKDNNSKLEKKGNTLFCTLATLVKTKKNK